MELIKSYSIRDCQYLVLKSFVGRPAGEKARALKIGEVIRFDDKTLPGDIIGNCKLGRIAADIPGVARYTTRTDFSLRVAGRKMESVKRGEVVEMLAEDAWPLLICGQITPQDPDAWAPDRLDPKGKDARKRK